MGQRKKRFVALVCAVSVIVLSSCGDDLTQQVCIPGVEELAQPIGGYHTGPQDDQPGDNIGEIVLPGGTDGDNTALPESGQSGASDTLMGERCMITISAAGDVTLGNHQEQDYSYSFRQAYDQAEDEGYFFENVRDIFEADGYDHRESRRTVDHIGTYA